MRCRLRVHLSPTSSRNRSCPPEALVGGSLNQGLANMGRPSRGEGLGYFLRPQMLWSAATATDINHITGDGIDIKWRDGKFGYLTYSQSGETKQRAGVSARASSTISQGDVLDCYLAQGSPGDEQLCGVHVAPSTLRSSADKLAPCHHFSGYRRR